MAILNGKDPLFARCDGYRYLACAKAWVVRVRTPGTSAINGAQMFDLAPSDAMPEGAAMTSWSTWLKRGLILFSTGVVVRGLAERRPDKLAVIAAMLATFVAVVGVGWLFAVRRER